MFLTTDLHLSMFVVAQAGRKLVAAPPTFSNPYVELEPRVQDQDAMIDALLNGHERRFETLADQYGLRYVAAAGEVRDALTEAAPPQLESLYSAGDVSIYQFHRNDELAGDFSNWFVPNLTAFRQTLASAGFEPTLLGQWDKRAAFKAVRKPGLPEYKQETYEGLGWQADAQGKLWPIYPRRNGA